MWRRLLRWWKRNVVFLVQFNRFTKTQPGRPLIAQTHALTTRWDAPWDTAVRVDLPQQLLATGLTWYWQAFPGPGHGPLLQLTPATVPRMVKDLHTYLEGRSHGNSGFMVYGCLAPVSLRIPEDEEEFKALAGPIRVWIEQVGDWQIDRIWVAPEVLPRVQSMLESWGFTFD